MSFIVHCGGAGMLPDSEMSSERCSSDRGGGKGAPGFGRLAIELRMESIVCSVVAKHMGER